MGGAPLTHPMKSWPISRSQSLNRKPHRKRDALASSPLFDPEPTEPLWMRRAREEEPARPDYAGFTMPTPQAVARSNAQAPKGRLRIDPVKNAASPAASRRPASRARCFRANLPEALLEGMGLSEMQPVPQFDQGKYASAGADPGHVLAGDRALALHPQAWVKADMTMVLDDANNPFKLLPTGKTVLDPDVRHADAGALCRRPNRCVMR